MYVHSPYTVYLWKIPLVCVYVLYCVYKDSFIEIINYVFLAVAVVIYVHYVQLQEYIIYKHSLVAKSWSAVQFIQVYNAHYIIHVCTYAPHNSIYCIEALRQMT